MASMPSHRQWMVSKCTSWIRAVRSDGTQIWMSVSLSTSCDLAAALAGQRDHDHLALVRCLDRGQHVRRIARRGDREQHVARLAERPDLLRENLLERVVVGDGGEHGAYRSSAQSRASPAARARTGRSIRRRNVARRRLSRRCRTRESRLPLASATNIVSMAAAIGIDRVSRASSLTAALSRKCC